MLLANVLLSNIHSSGGFKKKKKEIHRKGIRALLEYSRVPTYHTYILGFQSINLLSSDSFSFLLTHGGENCHPPMLPILCPMYL